MGERPQNGEGGQPRAALYARVSSERQEQEQTIRSQLDALRRYAHDRGYQLVHEYEDAGYSGATLARPGLDRLRDAARGGAFEVVVFHAPDRIARRAVYLEVLLEEFREEGVRVEFVNAAVDDSPEGKGCSTSTDGPRSWRAPGGASSTGPGRERWSAAVRPMAIV